jgi:hypothetical protein
MIAYIRVINIKYILLTSFFWGCISPNKRDNISDDLHQSIKYLEMTCSASEMAILYDVAIKPRDWKIQSEKEIVRFQKNEGHETLNIPIFLNDSPLINGMYYDLGKYAASNGILNQDSAVAFGRNYSNNVINLYYKLNVHEIRGGLPDLGEFVIMTLKTGKRLVFIPDTSKIFSQNWRERCFQKGKKVGQNIYLVPK